MEKVRIFLTLVLVANIIIVNFKVIQTQTVDLSFKRCPEGYTFHTDGLCYPNEYKPFPPNNINQTQTASSYRCPQGYILYTDNLCYPIKIKPCPVDSKNTTETPATTATTLPTTATTLPTTTTTESTTTTRMPIPSEIIKTRCPTGSIMLKNKCRKIICSMGEYYKGNCLKPVCPEGLIWRGKKCQKPGYLTTIIEINNEIINEQNEKPITLERSQTNEVIYYTTTTTQKPLTTVRSIMSSTTESPIKSNVSSTNNDANNSCCKVFTPRICKLYGQKWVCFNRKYHRCDKRICTMPVIYLKAPEILYEPPVLIMPPNPQFNMYKSRDSDINLNADCSGCAARHSETCSPYCYRYICPNNSCGYMDLNEYCNYYPGQNGCQPTDGCLWNWC
ncbi:uncharacterized protein LOC119612785 [Lucilia sericata]|uniref:uncharacterized protein LOC119612785 n=1 Tax=Lucilia sericata TaxID=13632 RepID=UPI0018A8658D|nr:uncharacterized protein LOC119612785 [Lucilia sericata]